MFGSPTKWAPAFYIRRLENFSIISIFFLHLWNNSLAKCSMYDPCQLNLCASVDHAYELQVFSDIAKESKIEDSQDFICLVFVTSNFVEPEFIMQKQLQIRKQSKNTIIFFVLNPWNTPVKIHVTKNKLLCPMFITKIRFYSLFPSRIWKHEKRTKIMLSINRLLDKTRCLYFRCLQKHGIKLTTFITRDIIFGTKLGQICNKWVKFGTFSDNYQSPRKKTILLGIT